MAAHYPEGSFTGYDISPDAINLSRPKTNKNLQFINGDLSSSDQYFDVIVMADVFEHVRDYLGFVSAISQHANYLVFHIPLDLSVVKALFPKKILNNRSRSGHLHYFNKETSLATLEDCNLKIIDWQYTRWGLEMKQKGVLKKIGQTPLFILDLISPALAARILGGNSLLVLAEKNTK